MVRVLNLILPIVVLLCVIAPVMAGVRSFFEFEGSEDVLLVVPGTNVVEISKPGDYTLWNHVSFVSDDTHLEFPDEIPTGTRITIFDLLDRSVVLWRPNVRMRRESARCRRVSFGTVTVRRAGSYMIEIFGIPNEGRAMSIEPATTPQSFFDTRLGLMSGLVLASGSLVWLGVAVTLILVRKAVLGTHTDRSPRR